MEEREWLTVSRRFGEGQWEIPSLTSKAACGKATEVGDFVFSGTEFQKIRTLPKCLTAYGKRWCVDSGSRDRTRAQESQAVFIICDEGASGFPQGVHGCWAHSSRQGSLSAPLAFKLCLSPWNSFRASVPCPDGPVLYSAAITLKDTVPLKSSRSFLNELSVPKSSSLYKHIVPLFYYISIGLKNGRTERFSHSRLAVSSLFPWTGWC